jgi:hypothetical protein
MNAVGHFYQYLFLEFYDLPVDKVTANTESTEEIIESSLDS